MNDQARAFFSKAEPDRSRIEFPEDIVFLCGGPLGTSATTVRSLRDYIFRHEADICAGRRVVLAERAAEKFDSNQLFDDLIELERYIASIARIILLVCESSGSIAELGAFSQVDEISGKLLVFVHDEHFKANSFIRNGPIRYLDNRNERAVQQFRWLMKNKNSVDIGSADTIRPSMTAAVKNFVRQENRTESFDQSKIGHRMLLVAGIVYYSRCCKIREIVEYAELFGVNISQSEALKYIFCLEIFGWIGSVKRDTRYYYYLLPNQPFGFRGTAPRGDFDPLRVRHDIAAGYAASDERLNVLAELVDK